MTDDTWTIWNLLHAEANDHEASILTDLAVKADILWRCLDCAATFDDEVEVCEFCGTPRGEEGEA